jgi:TetR/AcrR family transcriptional regulator, regulator of cefoperazone and chloramphenicol sensitivity
MAEKRKRSPIVELPDQSAGGANRKVATRAGGRTAAATGANSGPHRRAQKDRGAETRAQLIEAGLDVFGRLGFEGASTREIAKAADANLAAIVYHFGGKEALHLAVAEHVASSIMSKIGPTLAAAADPAKTATPATARAALDRLIETMIDVMLGSAEAERWARFIVREQLQPTAAFEVIYRFLGGAAGTATRLVATIVGTPEDETIRLRVFTMLGQVLVFRVAQTLVLRRMQWPAIGDRERGEIRRVVLQNIDAILEGVRP